MRTWRMANLGEQSTMQESGSTVDNVRNAASIVIAHSAIHPIYVTWVTTTLIQTQHLIPDLSLVSMHGKILYTSGAPETYTPTYPEAFENWAKIDPKFSKTE